MSANNFNSETELLLLLKEGTEEAFTIIFKRFYKEILFYAKRIVTHLDKAEEITVDAFMKLWDKRDQFSDTTALKRWLYLVVRNAAIDHLRQEKRLSREQSQLSYVTDADYLNSHFLDEAAFDLFKLIAEAVEQLAPQQKKIFLLFYKELKTNSEIASELNISVQAVKNTKSKALEILRRTISKEDLLLLIFAFRHF